ncbi:putative CRAL-TRIO lipid binding domain-containing protein [Helianthus debilis subsp. tardiflorus]
MGVIGMPHYASFAIMPHLEVKVVPKLERPFVVVYVHTDVCKSENFPGFSVLRTVYDAIPINVKQNLEWVYFVHPDLQLEFFLLHLEDLSLVEGTLCFFR